MRFDLIMITAVLILSASCQSTKKAAVPPGLNTRSSSPGEMKVVVPTLPALTISEASKTSPALIARPVTASGDNREPKFSPDGSKILFVSSQRGSHRHAQVYELDLVRSTERRVTFHDGDDEGISWASNSRFAYSSTTDEMKEGNYAIERLKSIAKSTSLPDSSAQGGEIYIQRLDGREIERLTHSPGADVSPDVDPTSNGARIAFASTRANGSKIFLMTPKLTRVVSSGKGDDTQPSFRNDGKALAWARSESDDRAKSRIFVSEDLKTSSAYTSEGFNDRHPTWHPTNGSILFSSNRGGASSDLYLTDKAGCLKRLTALDSDATDPAFSPDGSKIAFSLRPEGRSKGPSQIYVMEDRSSSLSCQ